MTRFKANKPDWKPLKQRASDAQCADFMWMYQDGAVHFCKHIITRRYLMLDDQGNCLGRVEGELRKVDFEPEYLRVTGKE
jgi:hypothetical protein